MLIDNNFSPFHSFWMAGFECSDQLNAFGLRVDLLDATGHIKMIDEDYENLRKFNIETVREGIRWSKVELKPYCYDWSSVITIIEAAQQHNIQVIWDLCHFGFPDDLTPLHPMFARRFAALCRGFIHVYRMLEPYGQLIIVPINEVNFLSWLGGDVRGTSPYCVGQGWEVKYMLMKAFIEGVKVLKEADPGVLIMTSEPLVNIVASDKLNELQQAEAFKINEYQFQVIEILCGRMCPELNGKPEYLDFAGFNFYYNNQWINQTNETLVWKDKSEEKGWKNLADILKVTYRKFNVPVVLTETSHPKEDRPLWIEHIATECKVAIESGVPLMGVCIYPIIDRPDWDYIDNWHHSGLWDIYDTSTLERTLYVPYAQSLLYAQEVLVGSLCFADDVVK